jgi:Fe-S cluster assembly ATPase SufC
VLLLLLLLLLQADMAFLDEIDCRLDILCVALS